MRAGLSTIQQTLTADAASVLNHSIAEAGRRNHGQTTPLHVAATLLSSPTGFLRQACIKSHPNSSHPLQCRALELCFSVALERLPTAAAASAAASASSDPPISNALMAALKRAQAHQRRGCPEQQQQPLLAVKVELEQLIISILDDPSVSRVMREASFSSPAVKATIEQTLTTTSATTHSGSAPIPTPPPLASSVGLGFRPGITVAPGGPARSLYANPRLHQNGGGGVGVNPGGGALGQPGQSRGEEVKRVVEIMTRGRKRNPVLVGDSEPEAVVREVLRRVEDKELAEGPMRTAEVVNLTGAAVVGPAERVKEVAATVEARMGKPGVAAVVLDLGDLKWLVEQPQPQAVSESGREAVGEVGKLLTRFGDRLWLIGTATCETYLRCQVYHPSMEIDWDLQAVPIAAKSPVPGLFPRLGTNGILSSSVESLTPMKAYAAAKLGPPRFLSENSHSDPSRKTNHRCPQCSQSYELELAKITALESDMTPSEVKQELNRPSLPLWLQNAKALDSHQAKSKDQAMALKTKTQELQKKWSDMCSQLHPSFHNASERLTPKPISLPGLFNPNLLNRQPPSQPKLQMNKLLGGSLQLSKVAPKLTISPPRSPVRTDLVLGPQDQITHNDRVKDLIGCIPSEAPKLIEVQRDDKMASKLDADSFKRLSKGLAEKVWWQPEAAVSVAATMTECRLDSARQRRGAASKGDMWILFLGPDRVGKRKMASALADLVSGSSPVVISLGSRRRDGDLDTSFRGKTVVDRIAEAVRRNPFSVVVLEDVGEADAIVRGNVKRAMERGRLADSHGREISLGNVVFVLTADWLPENLKSLWSKVASLDEERLGRLAMRPWELRLAVSGKKAKRRAHWLSDDDEGRTPTKPRNESNPSPSPNLFDLNEAAAADENGSHGSSDLTEDECARRRGNHPKIPGLLAAAAAWALPPPREVLEGVDDTIVFKPAELVAMRNGVMSTVSNRFSGVVGDGVALEMDEDALEKIVGGLWLGKASLEEWTEDVLVPSFDQIKSTLPMGEESVVVRLESDGESNSRQDLLPSSVKVVLTEA